MKKLKVKTINDSKNELPKYAKKGDSGMDLRADFSMMDNVDEIIINPGERKIIPLNIKTEIPKGYEAQIRPRSGLAANYGITVLNTPGTIDSGYREYWGVILIHLGEEPFIIKQGDRIAQAVFVKVENVKWITSKKLKKSDRNLGGYGHTGVK